MNKEDKESYERKKEMGGQFVNPIDDPSKTLSQAKAKVLQNIDTFFYIGTEVSRTVNHVALFKRNKPGRRAIAKR